MFEILMRLRVDFSRNLVSNPYFILQSQPGKSDYQLVFPESSNISKKLTVVSSEVGDQLPRSEAKMIPRVFVTLPIGPTRRLSGNIRTGWLEIFLATNLTEDEPLQESACLSLASIARTKNISVSWLLNFM